MRLTIPTRLYAGFGIVILLGAALAGFGYWQLTNIGSRKEVEQYLRHYASVDAPKFAVVKVSGALIDHSLEALASYRRWKSEGAGVP